VSADLKRSIFKIRLGNLKTVITIRMYFDEENRVWWFEQSHAIKTTGQANPYTPGVRSDADRAWLLSQAIGGFTQFYATATKKGFKPAANWLIKMAEGRTDDRHG